MTKQSNSKTSGFTVIEAIIIIVVLALLGGAGWFVYTKHFKQAKSASSSNVQSKTKSSGTTPPPVSPVSNPYASWKSYTSATENLTFKYPADWIATPSNDSTQVTGADSLNLKSPSGAVSVQWYSSVEGIGGACSVYVLPGQTSTTDTLGPCPYFYVLDKQKLTGADLYYVDGVEELSDGTGYYPWCGLQASDGIVQNESNIGYMLFKAKNTFAGTNDANRSGPYQAELACGSGFGGTARSSGTKVQATSFLSSPEMQQAKLILLSASY